MGAGARAAGPRRRWKLLASGWAGRPRPPEPPGRGPQPPAALSARGPGRPPAGPRPRGCLRPRVAVELAGGRPNPDVPGEGFGGQAGGGVRVGGATHPALEVEGALPASLAALISFRVHS